MSYRLPYPLPTSYDPSGPYRNPGNTNPLPPPADIPTPCWFGGGIPLTWSAVVGDPEIELRASWSSPIFDMRPDIRNVNSNLNSDGQPGRVSGVPIWNPAAQLWLQFENPGAAQGIRSVRLDGFQVLAEEQVHVCDPNNLRAVSAPEDVTAQFSTTGPSAILGWYPIGDGNPIRFYRLNLVFHMLKNFQGVGAPTVANAPVMTIRPAMY